MMEDGYKMNQIKDLRKKTIKLTFHENCTKIFPYSKGIF